VPLIFSSGTSQVLFLEGPGATPHSRGRHAVLLRCLAFSLACRFLCLLLRCLLRCFSFLSIAVLQQEPFAAGLRSCLPTPLALVRCLGRALDCFACLLAARGASARFPARYLSARACRAWALSLVLPRRRMCQQLCEGAWHGAVNTHSGNEVARLLVRLYCHFNATAVLKQDETLSCRKIA